LTGQGNYYRIDTYIEREHYGAPLPVKLKEVNRHSTGGKAVDIKEVFAENRSAGTCA